MSCSTSINFISTSVPDKRFPSSSIYECSFTSNFSGEKTKFSFIPEKLQLKIGSEIHYVQEDDIIPGGFSYRQGDNDKNSIWRVFKLEFISLGDSPKISMIMQKSNGQSDIISSGCSQN